MTLLKFRNEMPARDAHVFPNVNDLFNGLFDGMVTNDFKRWNTPAVNVIENDDHFKMQFAAPGMTKEDFKISVNEHTLTVSAETKSESTESKNHYTRKEFSFNNFSRSFKMPELVNVDGIAANYESGIMTLLLPKLEAKPRAREIKVG